MAEPVNLNRFRKQKARAEKKARASENAVKFGRTKAEKLQQRALAEKAEKTLEAHPREDDERP